MKSDHPFKKIACKWDGCSAVVVFTVVEKIIKDVLILLKEDMVVQKLLFRHF